MFNFIFKTLVLRNEAIYCLIGFGIGIGCCLVYKWFQTKLLKFKYIEMTGKSSDSNKKVKDVKKNNNDLSLKKNKRPKTNYSRSTLFLRKTSKNKKYYRKRNLNEKIKLRKGLGIYHLIKYPRKFSRYKRSQFYLNEIIFSKKKNNFSNKKVNSLSIQAFFRLSSNLISSSHELDSNLKFIDKSNQIQNLCYDDDKHEIMDNSLFDYSDQFKTRENENILNNNDVFICNNDLFQTNLSRQNSLFGNNYFSGKIFTQISTYVQLILRML